MKPSFTKRSRLCFGLLTIPLLLWVPFQSVSSQPALPDEKGSQIRLGEVTFRLREIESKPQALRLLELHVPVLNRSRTEVVPPEAVTVAAKVKSMELLGGSSVSAGDSGTLEATLNASLPPGTGRVVVLGFPLPEEKVSSITFEIQINPPRGELKQAIWLGQ